QRKLEELAPNVLYMEQYMDFFRNRTFRQTLLVHQNARINRKLTPASFAAFSVAARLQPREGAADPLSGQPVEYQLPGAAQTLTTTEPIIKAALAVLAAAWPQALPLAEVYARAAERLGRRITPTGLVEALARQEREASELGKLVYLGTTRRMVE